MSCKELVELITDYLEGKLSSYDRERFEEHLQMCRPCVFYLQQMRLTIQTTGALREEEISEEAKTALLQVFRNWKDTLPQ